jgi:hypothetical protein
LVLVLVGLVLTSFDLLYWFWKNCQLNFHVFNLISSGNFTQISTPFFAPYQDLHDTGFEYKNLPLFDAYNAIYFHYAKSIEKVKRVVNVHPDQIQHMFELLSNNRDMTTWQYDELIKYLQAQSYAALMEEKAKKEVKKEREMYQYEGPRHQIRQRGCCMDYDYENSNSDDDDSDDRYSKGKGKPKVKESEGRWCSGNSDARDDVGKDQDEGETRKWFPNREGKIQNTWQADEQWSSETCYEWFEWNQEVVVFVRWL